MKLSDKERRLLMCLLSKDETYGQELGGGTVYITLSELEDKGLLTSRKESLPAGVLRIPRSLYQITALGRSTLLEQHKSTK